MILIEVLLVLVDALSTGCYPSLPKKLTYYSFESVYNYVEKIRNNEYNWRNVLGLVKCSKLPLTNDEKKYLDKNYKLNYELIRKSITKFAQFYEKYRIIYGKYKHGLMVQTALNFESVNKKSLQDSILVTYDRRALIRMPKGYVESKPSGDYSNFFNAIGILSFNQNFDELKSMIDELRYVIHYICHNHLTYAKNCGEGYLPYAIENNKVVIKLAHSAQGSNSNKTLLQTIGKKILPLMNLSEHETTTNFRVTKKKILESISKNSVTNLWLTNAINQA